MKSGRKLAQTDAEKEFCGLPFKNLKSQQWLMAN
jgi:hypothetical protein